MDENTQKQIDEIWVFLNSLKSNSTIPLEVGEAIKARVADVVPSGLNNAPLTSITAPSGGLTADSEARSAINTIITRLEDLGLVASN